MTGSTGERVNLCSIAAEAFNRFAHCRQINNGRYAGKVLHQHSCRAVGNFTVSMGIFQPSRQRVDILFGNRFTILPTQQVFEQNFE